MLICRQARADKSFALAEPAVECRDAELTNRSAYDRLRYPVPGPAETLSRTLIRAMHAETERSLVLCAVALKRYALRHGTPPASLEALCPEFLAAVPIDYMDGQPLKYRAKADGTFTLYSVGDDRKDDSGDTSPAPGEAPSRNIWNGKDAVWPAPLLQEEVDAYRRGEGNR